MSIIILRDRRIMFWNNSKQYSILKTSPKNYIIFYIVYLVIFYNNHKKLITLFEHSVAIGNFICDSDN